VVDKKTKKKPHSVGQEDLWTWRYYSKKNRSPMILSSCL